MRKLITIFLAFSLLVTVFTVNTFAEGENDVQGTTITPEGILDQNNNPNPLEENTTAGGTPEPQAEELIDYTVEQNADGDLILTFDSKEHADQVEIVYFEEVSKAKAGPSGVPRENLKYNNATVTVTADIIVNVLQLKNNYTYKVYYGFYIEGVDNAPKEITLSVGANDFEVTANVDKNGNLVIGSTNTYILEHTTSISIECENNNPDFDAYVGFFLDEFEYINGSLYVPYDYLNCYKLDKNQNYYVNIQYKTSYGESWVTNKLQLGTVQFSNFEVQKGPELTGYVDDGVLHIGSKDGLAAGYSFMNSFWANEIGTEKAGYLVASINGYMCHFTLRKFEFDLDEDGLRINLLNDETLKKIDIGDNYKLYIRVPGEGISEITFSVEENSMKLDSATIIQNTKGDIIISSNGDLKFSNVTQINFRSENSEYYDSIFPSQFTVKDDKIHIPYVAIEKSNLKENHNYQVTLIYDSVRTLIVDTSFALLEGSQKKDLPEFTAIQDKDGNIVLNIDDDSFIENIYGIRFHGVNNSGYAYFKIEQLKMDSINKTQTIPYETIQKSQLTPGLYEIMFHYIDSNKYYFNGFSRKQINVDLGTTLSEIPEFDMYQEDNGNIVIESEDQKLLDSVQFVYYAQMNNQRAGSPSFSEGLLVREEGKITIPYQAVKYSWLEPDTYYEFRLQLKSDDIYLIEDGNDTKDVFIKTGSLINDAKYLEFSYENNGVLSLIFDDINYLTNLENGTYKINYFPDRTLVEETFVPVDSLIFDYKNKIVYITSVDKIDGFVRMNVVEGEKILTTGSMHFDFSGIHIDDSERHLDDEEVVKYVSDQISSKYPNATINIDKIDLSCSVLVEQEEAEKYFKVYGLTENNSLAVELNIYVNYTIDGSGTYSIMGYDVPGAFIDVTLSITPEQMSKIGITEDNLTDIAVLREHNGTVDELAATVKPVTVNGTIISFKVMFKTDKMSLFSLANKNSIVRPSSGESGSGSSSVTTPTKKPVVNTAAK